MSIRNYFSKTVTKKTTLLLKAIKEKNWNTFDKYKEFLYRIDDYTLLLNNLLDDERVDLIINYNIFSFFSINTKSNELKRFFEICPVDEYDFFISNNFYKYFILFSMGKHESYQDRFFEIITKQYHSYSSLSFSQEDDYDIDFYKHIKEKIFSNNVYEKELQIWKNFISILDTDIVKKIYSIEEFEKIMIENNNLDWNDIIVDYAAENKDILKYIDFFRNNSNLKKLIEILDDIDCDNIVKYNLVIQVVKCQSPNISVELLEKSNLSKEEQREILKLAPSYCTR